MRVLIFFVVTSFATSGLAFSLKKETKRLNFNQLIKEAEVESQASAKKLGKHWKKRKKVKKQRKPSKEKV